MSKAGLNKEQEFYDEAKSKLCSLVVRQRKQHKIKRQVRATLNAFRYLAQPKILEVLWDMPNFRRCVLSKIAEFQKEPLIQ